MILKVIVTKRKLVALLWSIVYILILFSNIIEQKFAFFNYIDESILFVATLYICIKWNDVKHSRVISKIIIVLILTCMIGIIGNSIFNFQTSHVAIIKDMVSAIKFPIISCALIVRKNTSNDLSLDDEILKIVQLISKLYLDILFVFGIVSLLKNNIGLTYDLRNGIYSYKFLYPHPTFLVYNVVIISVVIMASTKGVSGYIYQCMAIFILIISMRDKAFAYIVVLVGVLALKILGIKKFKVKYLSVAAIIAFFISSTKINEYRSYTWSPREALLKNGIELAKKCFPFGSGFASFGGVLSGEYYSSAYSLFGMDLKDGTSPINYIDLSDSGLPYYYASFGFIGFIMFVYIGFLIFKQAYKFYVGNTDKLRAMILVLSYILVCLPFENFLTNESGATVVLILFIYIGSISKKETNL